MGTARDLRKDIRRHLPHDVARLVFAVRSPARFRALERYRRTWAGSPALGPFEATGTLFVHIPKTAGIAVAESLYGQQCGSHMTIDDYRRIYPRSVFDDLFKFTIVRDPVERVRSAFRFLMTGGLDADDREFARDVMSDFPDFETFVMEGLSDDRVLRGVHFRPQHTFVCPLGTREPAVDFIGRFKFIERDYQRICERAGIGNRPLRRRNVTAPPTPLRADVTPEIRRRIAEIYADDYSVFGYWST